MSEQSRKPKGSPASTGGEFDTSGNAGGGDLPALAPTSRGERRALYEKLDGRERSWRWLDERLRAGEVRRVKDADGNILIEDHRGEEVASPEFEVALVSAAVGTTDHMGKASKALNKYITNRAEAVARAQEYMDERMTALRQAVAVDPTRCYSKELVAKAVRAQVNPGRILRKPPYSMSEHRMRVGLRFKRNCSDWAAAHGLSADGTPPNDVRDAIWNDTLHDYIDEKIARGVSYGGGLIRTDGHTADPKKDQNRLHYNKDHTIRNGRVDFENMLDRGMKACHGDSSDELKESGIEARAESSDEMQSVFDAAFDRGLDENVIAQRLGIPSKTVEKWRDEWLMRAS